MLTKHWLFSITSLWPTLHPSPLPHSLVPPPLVHPSHHYHHHCPHSSTLPQCPSSPILCVLTTTSLPPLQTSTTITWLIPSPLIPCIISISSHPHPPNHLLWTFTTNSLPYSPIPPSLLPSFHFHSHPTTTSSYPLSLFPPQQFLPIDFLWVFFLVGFNIEIFSVTEN